MMAWPYTTTTTYVANNTPAIKAADLNNIQSAIANLQSGAAPIIYQANGASSSPLLKFGDSAGNQRWLIDHNGFPTGGRFSVFREEWLYNYNASGVGTNYNATFPVTGNNLCQWWATTHAAGNVTVAGPALNQNYSGGYLSITGETASSSSAFIRTAGLNSSGVGGTFVFSDNTVLLAEFEASTPATPANNYLQFGFLTNITSPTSAATAGVFMGARLGTDTNWQAYLADGSSSTNNATSTGVAISTFSGYPGVAFRVEYHGKNTALGVAAYGGVAANTAKAIYYVNGVQTNVLSASTLTTPASAYALFGVYCTATATAVGLLVGPVVIAWNRGIINPPAL